MGKFVNKRWLVILSWILAICIACVNAYLLVQQILFRWPGWFSASSSLPFLATRVSSPFRIAFY